MFRFLCLLAATVCAVQASPTGNPCWRAEAEGKRYYPYPGSSTRFIQCNEWGGAYIVSCPDHHTWSQEEQTCVMTTTDIVEKKYSNSDVDKEQENTVDDVKYQTSMDGYNEVDGEYKKMEDEQTKLMDGYENGMEGYTDVNGEYMRVEEPEMEITINAYGNGMDGYSDVDGEYVKMEEQEAPVDMATYGMDGYHEVDGEYQKMEEEPVDMATYGMDGYHEVDGEYQKMEDAEEDAEMTTMMTPAMHPKKFNIGLAPMYTFMKTGDSVQSRNMVESIPCSMTKMMYMPHYINPHWYYECVKGSYRLKQCSKNELWNQKAQKCHKLVATVKTAPVIISKSKKSSVPSSPCIDPKVKTLPYPADQQRYVVCYSRTSWEVKSCADGEFWLNPLARCIRLSDLLRTSTIKPRENLQEKYNARCAASKSFHLAYEEDSTKFIQCDESKRAFLRACGPHKVWDDASKTCIGMEDMETDDDKDVSSSTGTTENNNGGTLFTFNATIQTTGDELLLDVLNDPSTQYYPCPHGTITDPYSGECATIQSQEDFIFGPNCDDGYLWDTQIQMCVKVEKNNRNENSLFLDIVENFNNIPSTTTETTNPCLSGEGFYFPAPGQPGHFIQCDQIGRQHLMPCPGGLVWSQAIKNCVPPSMI